MDRLTFLLKSNQVLILVFIYQSQPKLCHYWHNLPDPFGFVARRSLTALENRSSIPDAMRVTKMYLSLKSDWPTLVGSVCLATLVSASADRDFKPGSKC